MESLTIGVSRSTHGRLREPADRTVETMAEIVDLAVRKYQEERFWAEYHAVDGAIQADPVALAGLQEEVDARDSTLADGLEVETDERPS